MVNSTISDAISTCKYFKHSVGLI